MTSAGKHAHRFFTKLLISSLIIVLISLGFSYGINMYTYNMLEAEISASHRTSLIRFGEMMDAKLSEVFTTFQHLSRDDVIKSTISIDSRNAALTPGELLDAHRRMSTVPIEHVDSVFVYFPNSDRVISRNRLSTDLSRYLDCYFTTESDRHDEIEAAFDEFSAMRLIPLGNSRSMLVLHTITSNYSRRPGATAAVTLSTSFVSTLLQDWTPADGMLMLIDDEGRCIISSSPIAPDIDLSSLPLDTAYAVLELDGQECILQAVESTLPGYHYLSIVPVRVFWERLNTVRATTVLAFLLFAALSMALALLLTKRNYAPISHLVSELKLTKPGKGLSSGDEIAYIRHTIRETFDEKLQLHNALRDDHLYRAMYQNTTITGDMQEQMARSGIEFLSDRFTVVLVSIERSLSDEIPNEWNSSAVQHILEDMQPAGTRVYALYEKSGLYPCLINHAASDDSHVLSFCEHVSSFLSRNMRIAVTIACGLEHIGFAGMHQSYREALSAMQYRDIYGPGATLAYTAHDHTAFRYNFSARADSEQLLTDCIKCGNPSPEETLSAIHDRCCGTIRMPEEFKCYYFDMTDLLRRISARLSLPDALMDGLYECDNLVNFESALSDVLLRMHNTYCQADGWDTRRLHAISTQVRAFIDQSFSDPSLSVTAVGQHFNMSGQYLSRLFREDQGDTISAYITDVRIAHSRTLLTETTLSIDEVSESCGFLSSSTFIRLFKKVTGVTPGIYRKENPTAD